MGRPPRVKPDDEAEIIEDAEVIEQQEQPAAPSGPTVTFTGDPSGRGDPAEPEYGGISFPKGKAVPVTAEWLNANPNIRKNNHFKVD